jgi:hypothetical protein
MLDGIRALAEALARDDASVKDLVARLDGRADEHATNVIVEEAGFGDVARANVVRRRPDDDLPAHLVLELREPLELEPLAELLGEPATVYPDHRGAPVQLVYPEPLVAAPHPVTLVAEAAAGAPARSVVLRRD